MKRIFCWFTDLRSDEKHLNAYLQKDDQEKDIYYPWGCSGESYYIDSIQKQKLKGILNLRVWLWLFSLPIIFLYFELSSEGQYKFNWVLVLTMTVYLLAHIFSTSALIKKLELQPARSKIRTKPKLFQKLFKFFLLQIILIFVGLLYNPDNYFLWITGLFVVVFYPIFILFAWHRKGYIFQNKPLSL